MPATTGLWDALRRSPDPREQQERQNKPTTDEPAGIRCSICDRLAPITVADLTGPGRDDASTEYTGWSIEDHLKPTAPSSGQDLPLVVAPTPAWMNVPEAIDTQPDRGVRDEDYDDTHRPEFDPDRIMCMAHASAAELDAWLDQLNDTERIVDAVIDEAIVAEADAIDDELIDPDD